MAAAKTKSPTRSTGTVRSTGLADHDYGVGVYPALGMQWVFSHVEAAIFFEDDCVPDPTFFPFCYELLEKYREDERVMVVAGSNVAFGLDIPHSYYFGTYGNCWGLATWRRAFAATIPGSRRCPGATPGSATSCSTTSSRGLLGE